MSADYVQAIEIVVTTKNGKQRNTSAFFSGVEHREVVRERANEMVDAFINELLETEPEMFA